MGTSISFHLALHTKLQPKHPRVFSLESPGGAPFLGIPRCLPAKPQEKKRAFSPSIAVIRKAGDAFSSGFCHPSKQLLLSSLFFGTCFEGGGRCRVFFSPLFFGPVGGKGVVRLEGGGVGSRTCTNPSAETPPLDLGVLRCEQCSFIGTAKSAIDLSRKGAGRRGFCNPYSWRIA